MPYVGDVAACRANDREHANTSTRARPKLLTISVRLA